MLTEKRKQELNAKTKEFLNTDKEEIEKETMNALLKMVDIVVKSHVEQAKRDMWGKMSLQCDFKLDNICGYDSQLKCLFEKCPLVKGDK